MQRKSGILMPISSLPSKYGIGTFGREAYKFADFLSASGQSVWQILPLGPTGYADSPYASFSTFAGNPYFIDLDMLIADGLLKRSEVTGIDWGSDPRRVDYGRIYAHRFELLSLACGRGWERDAEQVSAFRAANIRWLPDYALFMALKRHFGMKSWQEWPDDDIRLRRNGSVERYTELLQEDIRLFTYIQFLFYRQWDALRDYVHSLGIEIVGDLPIYVAPDSADLWAEPQFFQLDADLRPTCVAGVPPDSFTADGQLWGNALYDWDAMKADGYGWWIRRIEGALKLYDVIRVDHFRGFESYWSVPAGAETARGGEWLKGPGMDLIGVLKGWFPRAKFIAEDLGYMTPGVIKLLEDSGFPGMKPLQFAFGEGGEGFLPHSYGWNSICYVGTHDNPTLRQWLGLLTKRELKFAQRYCALSEEEGYDWGILRMGQLSPARLFVAAMQDYLGLGADCRMNTPGITLGNWRWRALPGEIDRPLARRIYELTRMYGRLNPLSPEPKKSKKTASPPPAAAAESE